jgi:hypothetical protein
MKNPWIFPATALALGAVGGFMAGKNTATPADAAKEEGTGPRIRSSAGRTEAGGDSSRRATASNRARSMEEAFRTPGQTSRIQALMDYYAGLTPEQLEAEAAKLEDLPMGERIMASFLLFGKWAETDPMAAMAYTNKMGMAGNFVRPTVLQSWASSDPQGAAEYFKNNPREFAMMGMMGGGRGPGGGSSAASVIASEWAKQDPAAAMAWAGSLTGNDKGSAMRGVAMEVADSDPAKAWSMVAGMDEDTQGRAYRDIAGKWGAKDFAEAERQIASLPAEQRAEALASAIEGYAKDNPKQAVLKLASLPAGDDRDDATRTAIEYWSRDNAKEAAAWVMASADETAKGRSMRELMPNFVNQDATGAREFVNGLPAGEVRDDAVSSYVFSDRTSPPADRLKMAETITDEESRNRSVNMVAGAWMMEDPKAANEYIQSSSAFSDEAKARAAEGRPIWGGGGRGPGGGRGGR